jgi:alkylation response protein AidB-like acyl-CoA dehydrogenase
MDLRYSASDEAFGDELIALTGAGGDDPGLRLPSHLGSAEKLGCIDRWSFRSTIAAGTSQIQGNVIAERILGMPKGS